MEKVFPGRVFEEALAKKFTVEQVAVIRKNFNLFWTPRWGGTSVPQFINLCKKTLVLAAEVV